MIKEALQYVVGLGRAEEHNIYDDKYSDKPLYRIDPYIPKAEAIVMHTLTSLVDYIKAHIDDMTEKNDHRSQKSGRSGFVFTA